MEDSSLGVCTLPAVDRSSFRNLSRGNVKADKPHGGKERGRSPFTPTQSVLSMSHVMSRLQYLKAKERKPSLNSPNCRGSLRSGNSSPTV